MKIVSSIATPLVVEVKDRTYFVFNKYPYKSMEDDSVGAFSFIPHGVLLVNDVRAYIHCEIEETSSKDILDLYTNKIMDDIGNPKLEFAQRKKKGFTQFVNFLTFDEKEWVRYVLSRIHAEFICLDKPCKITAEAIKVVTYLNQTDEKLGLQKVTNPTVKKLTGVEFDERSMKIRTIK